MIDCHPKISPGQIQDWQVSKHSEHEVTCSTCLGDMHKTAEDYTLAQLADEKVCAEFHEDQFKQFSTGKHNYGWNEMKKDLGEIKELARTMRATHVK